MVFRDGDHAAAAGDDPGGQGGEGLEGGGFPGAEARLPLPAEDLRDSHMGIILHRFVTVGKGQLERICQGSPGGGLAAAGETNQDKVFHFCTSRAWAMTARNTCSTASR